MDEASKAKIAEGKKKLEAMKAKKKAAAEKAAAAAAGGADVSAAVAVDCPPTPAAAYLSEQYLFSQYLCM